jgi:hypothetical protein
MDTGTLAGATAPPLFAIELSLPAQDLQNQWRRCNMLANYIAEYVAYQFPEREWAENLISTVTNEFLEAIVSLSPAEAAVRLSYLQRAGDLQIEIEHGLRAAAVQPYTTFLNQLAGSDTDELYFGLLTAADRPALDFNPFGLVMLVHDFKANISARLAASDPRIQIRVIVPTSEIAS